LRDNGDGLQGLLRASWGFRTIGNGCLRVFLPIVTIRPSWGDTRDLEGRIVVVESIGKVAGNVLF